MPGILRLDVATRPQQLAAYTTVGTSAVRPWANDANAAAAPTTGVLVQLDSGSAPGSYLETGGHGITPGNGIQIGVGQSDLMTVPNAAAVWIVPSAAGLVVRGQVR